MSAPLKTAFEAAITRSDFEFYMLKARRYNTMGWKLTGYRLLHIDGSGKRPIKHPDSLDQKLEARYPEGKQYLPDPPIL